MKQQKQLVDFFNQQAEWFAQFNNVDTLDRVLDLCESAGLYFVDKNQRVFYWSQRLEQLSGLPSEKVVGKQALPEYWITDKDTNQEQFIKISGVNGDRIEVKKTVRVLHDKEGGFAGGIGLLADVSVKNGITTKASTEVVRTVMGSQNFHGLLSRSPGMRDVFQIIENAAETEATVLVRGESGSGKELVAKAIHELSARHKAPFLAINCAALSSNLLESELFGHVRGAFTGAIKDHNGLFQRADGGTLFLDEVAEIPLELQAKLLRVLQERNYTPVGGDRSINVDVRIVAATHRSLREEVKRGRFREDLMYRLRVVPIFIPPLRERREDISLLIWHFISQHNAKNFRKIEKIEPQAMRNLLDYAWPGNIRELQNVVEYAFAVGRGTSMRCFELPPEFREFSEIDKQPSEVKSALILTPQKEAMAIRQALVQYNGSISSAASSLGMSRATFWRKRKLYDI